MSDEVLVRVEAVSKKYCRDLKRSLWYGVKDTLSDLIGRDGSSHELRPSEFWALNGVSIEIRRGECLGLIGRNGAGKTTLLKLLNGLIKPDSGRIEMRGRVGALIALGAGFNPILSGRENIYVNASVLGMSRKEISAHLDEIIDFAEIADFIDSPVQNYSSGMQVRLGFAIATAIDPDVLLLDEVLAVGDAAFRNKCYRRIASMRRKAAIVFVSHNMEQVSRVCGLGMVLASGRTQYVGHITEAISTYDRLNVDSDDSDVGFLSVAEPITHFESVIAERQIKSGAPFSICVSVEAADTLPEFLFKIFFYNAAGAITAEANCHSSDHGVEIHRGRSSWTLQFESLPLKGGCYRVGLHIVDPYGEFVAWSYKQNEVVVSSPFPGASADCQLVLKSWMRHPRGDVPIQLDAKVDHP